MDCRGTVSTEEGGSSHNTGQTTLHMGQGGAWIYKDQHQHPEGNQERVLQVLKPSSPNTEQGKDSRVSLEEKWLRLRLEWPENTWKQVA